MFWAVSIETVGKKHDKTVVNVPFSLTRSDELVNHNLSAISKITKLGFPECQSVWQSHSISILETKHSILR